MKKKIGTALLSLLIAFGMWLYVVSVVSPESEQTYYDVPVKLHGSNMLESRGLMMISDQNVQLDLKLSGTRTDLNKLSSANITVIADVSGITSAGTHTVSYDISYPGDIVGGITVLSPEKQTITIEVAERAQKEVSIEVEYAGALPADYTADKKNIVLDRSTVTISGIKGVVDRVEKAVITIDLTDRTEDIDQAYTLSFLDAAGQEVELVNAVSDAKEVTAALKISMLKTVDIVVEIIPGGGIQKTDISYILERNHLVVSGPASVLEDLNEITLTVDLGKLNASQVLVFDIELPDDVTNVTGVSQVTVDVTIPEVTTKTVAVSKSQFQVINVPEDMEVSFITEQLSITFQGRENRIKALKAENIRVIIDFAGAVEGKMEYAVTIEVVGLEGVGVISEHTVYAEVTPTKPEA